MPVYRKIAPKPTAPVMDTPINPSAFDAEAIPQHDILKDRTTIEEGPGLATTDIPFLLVSGDVVHPCSPTLNLHFSHDMKTLFEYPPNAFSLGDGFGYQPSSGSSSSGSSVFSPPFPPEGEWRNTALLAPGASQEFSLKPMGIDLVNPPLSPATTLSSPGYSTTNTDEPSSNATSSLSPIPVFHIDSIDELAAEAPPTPGPSPPFTPSLTANSSIQARRDAKMHRKVEALFRLRKGRVPLDRCLAIYRRREDKFMAKREARIAASKADRENERRRTYYQEQEKAKEDAKKAAIL
ncbi:hypothetical protein BJ875DRAFT_55132 [Amylocarpus encephaloides]|uniref:Uncharacterized protein n=1 Tax=Amylocarpus encephaloides TaxID=45428 RepID=A0A9P7YGD8_9HELO|nr:hypothetical protein BJ875DRAFT_55132 [Amylocarpus encephaloides]